MSELLFIALVLIDLCLVLIAARLGKTYLSASVAANIIFTNIIAGKLITVFGVVTTVGNATYCAIFLATNILNEHYGKAEARRAIYTGFFGLLWIIILGPIVALLDTAPYAIQYGEAISKIFSTTARISAASLIAYLTASLLDVSIYDALKRRNPHKAFIYIRNNVSTLTGQTVDQLMYITLAFTFSVNFNVLLQLFISGLIIKWIVALINTPFIYFSYYVVPQNEIDKVKLQGVAP